MPVIALPSGFCLGEDGAIVLGVFIPHASPAGEEQVIKEELQSFMDTIGHHPAIGVFSDEWATDRKFPLQSVDSLRKDGIIPYIRLMLRSSDRPYQSEPLYTLHNIAQGKFDSELRAWAREARSVGSPILIEYGTEVNTWNYPWNGYWNGYQKAHDAFRDAYRHIIAIMREEGASNLIWIYHVNAESQPDEEWNIITSYYPGDEYCDLVALSIFGTTKPFESRREPFNSSLNAAIHDIKAGGINKPILLITGTDVHNQYEDPAIFVSTLLSSLAQGTWPDIRGLIWVNAAWKNDNNPLHDTTMKLEDNASVSAAYKAGLKPLMIQERLACS